LTCSDDFSSGTTEVLAVADEFLWLHPYEAVFMRVKNENDVDEGFDTKFTAALDKHPRVYTGKDDNPTLGTIRGKIVILQNFSSGTTSVSSGTTCPLRSSTA
jgi:1-phosphatidylinositol phosphodiesterase